MPPNEEEFDPSEMSEAIEFAAKEMGRLGLADGSKIEGFIDEFKGLEIPEDSLTFRISCKNCGSNAFEVSYDKDIASEDLDADEIDEPPPGLIMNCEGRIEVHCVQCNATEQLFDLKYHGYDGELNDPEGFTDPETKPRILGGKGACHRVTLTLSYQGEADELAEIAKRSGKPPADLFDCICIDVKPTDGSKPFCFSYECA